MSDAFAFPDERHRALREFLTGQLNPDWDDDHDSWQEAVNDLVRWNMQTAAEALSSLDALLATTPDDTSAKRALDEIGFAGFLPWKMGPSVLGWLRDLRAEFAKDLGGAHRDRN